MITTPEHDERIANLTFASVYPHYITKVEKKGRTTEELHQVIERLEGFNRNPNYGPLCHLYCTIDNARNLCHSFYTQWP